MLRILFLILPVFLAAEDLKSILEESYKNNNLLRSKKYTLDAKAKEIESQKSSYFPTLDIGAFYENTTNTSLFQIADKYSAYAKAGINIYDGGATKANVEKLKNEHLSALYGESGLKKNISLEIVQDFYEIKSLEGQIKAKDDAKASIQEQLQRMKRFVEARLSTSDEVDRLQASFDTVLYEIEAIKFEVQSVKKRLALKIGREIERLDESHFRDEVSLELEQADIIKSLMYTQEAILSSARAIESIYYPTIRLQDTYTQYGYIDVEPSNPLKIDHQNVATLSLNMRIFDYGAIKEAKEALVLNSKSINEELTYRTKEQTMYKDLSLLRLDSVKSKMKSAKSALVAATSAFKIINEKYNASIVDYVVYLEALSSKTNAQALYERSLNDLEIAYATYYYYSGKKIEEFIK